MSTQHKPRRRSRLGLIAIICLLAVVSALGALLSLGGRLFVVETPSMGTYAPVGTLVVTLPVQAQQLTSGQMITFVPPGNDKTYFHRINTVDATGIHTKGDLNPSVDPWVLTAANLRGSEALHVVHLGWLLKALPMLLLGGSILWVAIRRHAPRLLRFPLYVTGAGLLLALTNFLLQPWFRATLLDRHIVDHVAQVQLVSTGILPINAALNGGPATFARDGQAITLAYRGTSGTKDFIINITPHLSPIMLGLVIALILLPLVLTGIYATRLRRQAHAPLAPQPEIAPASSSETQVAVPGTASTPSVPWGTLVGQIDAAWTRRTLNPV